MKKLLCIIATRMEPGLIQNIIARLGSNSPALFVTIQKYAVVISSILGIILGSMVTHKIPDFRYENYAIMADKFLIALFLGIGGGAALPTTDPKLIGGDVKGVVINEAQTKADDKGNNTN